MPPGVCYGARRLATRKCRVPGALLQATDEKGCLEPFDPEKEGLAMDLTVWIPVLFLLGLVTMALLFAFVVACDRV